MTVAARYRGDSRSVSFGRQLIGPELFPTYLKVLTINVVITALIVLAILLVGGGTLWSSIYGGLVPIAIQFTIITGVFIYADHRYAKDPDAWYPMSVGKREPIDYTSLDGLANALIGEASREGAVHGLAAGPAVGAFALAFLRAIGVPEAVGPIVPGPAWTDLYAPAVALTVFGLIGPIATLLRPTWVRFRVATRALVDGLLTVLLLISLAIGEWVVLGPTVSTTDDVAGVVAAINLGVGIGAAVTMVFSAISCVLEVLLLRQLSAA